MKSDYKRFDVLYSLALVLLCYALVLLCLTGCVRHAPVRSTLSIPKACLTSDLECTEYTHHAVCKFSYRKGCELLQVTPNVR